MKTGDRVLIAPQVTGRADWTEATVIEVEQNPYVGTVITAKADDGEIFFEKEDMFKLLDSELCTQ
ncbi:MAG: transcriptional regulator [Bergeyella sp.]